MKALGYAGAIVLFFTLCPSCNGSGDGALTEVEAYEAWCKIRINTASLHYAEYDCTVDEEGEFEECVDLAEYAFDNIDDDEREETRECFECLHKELESQSTEEEYDVAWYYYCEDLCEENGTENFFYYLGGWDPHPDCDICGNNLGDVFSVCCGESDPCDLGANGYCDCVGCDWDADDCEDYYD